MNEEKLSYHNLKIKEFVSFLLHHCIDEASVEYESILNKLKLSLNYPEESQPGNRQNVHFFLSSYFQAIISKNYYCELAGFLIAHESTLITLFGNTQLAAVDLQLLFTSQRILFTKCIRRFAKKDLQWTDLLEDVETFIMLLEKHSTGVLKAPQENTLNKVMGSLSSFLDNTIDGISIFDKDLKFVEWNKVMENYLGITRSQVVNKNLLEVFPEFNNTEELKALKKALKGEKMYLPDLKIKNKKNDWFEAYFIPYINNKKITGAISIYRKISLRKETELKLKEKQEQLETTYEILKENYSLLENAQKALQENESRLKESQAIAHLGNWEYDIESNSVYWSDEMKRIFGFHPSHPVVDYETYLSHIHPEDREMVNSTIHKTFQSFEPYTFEHRIVRKDGETRWVCGNGYTVFSENRLTKLKGTALDITERKAAELKILEEQHFIRKITDTSPEIITVYDLQKNKTIYYNKKLTDILGFSNHQRNEPLLQRNFVHTNEIGASPLSGRLATNSVVEEISDYDDFLNNLFHPEDSQKFGHFLEGFRLNTDNTPKEIEYRIKNAEGNYRWMLARYTVFKVMENGLPGEILGFSTDITEKKEASKILEESEAKLKESQRLACLGHWEFYPETQAVYWSQGLYEIYGIPFNTPLTLDRVKPFILSEDFYLLREKIYNAVTTGEAYQIEYRIRHRESGSVRTLFSRGTPVKSHHNKVIYLKGITQDITERKKIEIELEESQKFIKGIAESVPNIIFTYDVINKRGLYSNRSLGLQLGYTEEEINELGNNFMKKVVHPDYYQALMDRDEKVKASKGNETFEVFIKAKHANGDWRWLRSLSKIYKYNARNMPWQILGVLEDVTEKKAAEEKLTKAYQELQELNQELKRTELLLKETNNELEQRVAERTKDLSDIINQLNIAAGEQQKFTSLVENSINFISMADLEGNIIYVNDSGLKMVGLDSLEEAQKTKVADYYCFKSDMADFKNVVGRRLLEKKQISYEAELKHFKTGKCIPVYSNAFRIDDPHTGKPLALANVSHDLSEHKQKEKEIQESKEQLKKINKALNLKNEELIKTNVDLDNFVYTASHDLKSPISNLEGLLLILEQSVHDRLIDDEKSIMEMISKSIYKLKDTIRALVDITKAQKNVEQSQETISISALLEEVMAQIKGQIQEARVEIKIDLKAEHVYYARINLTSILYNLISNAIKYRSYDKKPKIFIRSYKEDDYTIIAVKDNGLGIPDKLQAKLFSMFKRFHSHVEGTGIGLYIIKRIVENNDGKIEVESKEGKGSCFKVYLKNKLPKA